MEGSSYTWKRVRRRSAAPHRPPRRRGSGRWKYALLAFLTLALIAVILVPLFLKPYRDRAATFDLQEITRLEEASMIYDRYGKESNRIFVENRLPVPYEEIPEHLIRALVAVEDSRFYEHKGVDLIGICRAFLLNLQALRVTQGASTITQQLARQSFELTERSLERKLVEAFLAVRIEKYYSKREILEHYLNRIFFGHEYYGVNAASLGYFGKPVKELDLAESAMLCGLIKSPNNISPLRNRDRAKRERNYVLDRMREEGMIDAGECRRLQSSEIRLNPQPFYRRSSYVYDMVRQQVFELIGAERAKQGGFRIYTTVDENLQTVLRDSLQRQLDAVEKHPEYEHQTLAEYGKVREAALAAGNDQPPAPAYLQGAGLVVDNQTGGIVAMVGGREFVHSQYNRALQSKRHAGTAFTPFVFAAAFESGYFPGTLVRDDFMDNTQVMIGAEGGILGEWGSESTENTYLGDIPARRALMLSKNAAAVRLGFQVGLEKVSSLAKRAGIESPLSEYPKTFLGESELSMAELCKAYTVFPNGGNRPRDLHMVTRIETKQGAVIYQVPASAVQRVEALDPAAAYQTHSCLRDALLSGTGQAAAGFGLRDAADMAGKTGTSYDFKDAWFVGYDSRLTAAVWMGFDQPQKIYRGAFSSQLALPVWVEVMNGSLEAFPPAAVQAPSELKAVEICTVSGKLATDACYEKGVPTPGNPTPQYVRCTYVEYVRQGTALSQPCTVHAEAPRLDPLLNPLQAGMLAADGGIIPNTTNPVYLQEDSILGEDPYRAVVPAAAPAKVVGPEDEEKDAMAEVKGIKPRIVFPTGIGDGAESRLAIPPPPPLDLE